MNEIGRSRAALHLDSIHYNREERKSRRLLATASSLVSSRIVENIANSRTRARLAKVIAINNKIPSSNTLLQAARLFTLDCAARKFGETNARSVNREKCRPRLPALLIYSFLRQRENKRTWTRARCLATN